MIGLLKKNILFTLKKNKKKIDIIVRHIRNSIAHGNVTLTSQGLPKNSEITHVKFKDYLNHGRKKRTFEAKIPVETLKEFTLKFASTMLEIIKKAVE